jgi:hypothetical protein
MNLARLVTVVLALCAVPLLAWAVVHPATQAFIEASGVHIPTGNVIADFTWGILWACLLLLSIFAWPVSWEHKKMLAMGWLTKCFTALVLMLPYEEHYYGLDCWTYFQNAHNDVATILNSLTRSGGDIVVAIGALHLKIGPDSYHAMKVSFGMFGLLGIYLFFRAAEVLLERRATAAFWILTLYPSVLFWSSILGKDPLVLLAIGIHVWGLAKLATDRRPRYFVPIIAGVLAVSTIRIWMGPILIVPCVLVIISRLRSMPWRIVTVGLIATALATLGSATVSRLSLQNASGLIEATRAVTDGWENANSSLDRDVELNSAWDLALFAPRGLFDTFFRPLPGDVTNLFGWMAGFENLALLLLSIWAAFRFRIAHLQNSVFLWSLLLLLTWGLAYCLITHRDLGTAVRFKLQILPILVGVIGYLIRQPRRLVSPVAMGPYSRIERAA